MESIMNDPAIELNGDSRAHVSHDEKTPWQSRWERNKGLFLVLLSEMFGACMAASTRLLELPGPDGSEGMSVSQILFARFSITLILSSTYMWYAKVPHFPLGKKEIRGLLVIRGFAGFMGVSGFYYSLMYLPLAEAVVIGFLAPLFTAYACSFLLREPLSYKQVVAGLISLAGVIIIAQPFALFISSANDNEDGDTGPRLSFIHRLSAIGMGLMAVFAATAAYTSIRVIGDRAHPLISVNYYAAVTTLLSSLMLFLPLPIFANITFRLPHDLREWTLLAGIGISGFLLQFLLTAGLQKDRSARATNMMYTQVLFSLLLDWLIWGSTPGVWSWIGGAVVILATVWGSLQKSSNGEQGSRGDRNEVYAIVDSDDDEDDEDIDEDLEDNGIDTKTADER